MRTKSYFRAETFGMLKKMFPSLVPMFWEESASSEWGACSWSMSESFSCALGGERDTSMSRILILTTTSAMILFQGFEIDSGLDAKV